MRTLIPMLLAFVVGFFAVRQLTGMWLKPAPTPAPPPAKAFVRQEAPAPASSPPAVEPVVEPVVAPTVTDPQAELASAIADLHDRLQGANPLEVMMQYMAPSVLKSMSAANLAQMKKMYEDAGQPGTMAYQYVQYTIRMLHSIQGTEPEMNNVADIATFRIPIAAPAMLEGKVPTTIKFYFEEGRWYLIQKSYSY